MQPHNIVSRAEWIEARKVHMAHEKEFTRARDRLAEERRALPWVKVDRDYVFDGPSGKVKLADLFKGRHQVKSPPRGTKVDGLFLVGKRGASQHGLRNHPEHLFCQPHQILIRCIRLIEFDHCELGIVPGRDPFVPEIAVDFKHPFKSPNHQALQVEFRGDTQI